MTQINTPLRAWFGDPDLKEQVVLKLKKHRQQDEIIQGYYQNYSETDGGYQGCAVGCTLPLMYKYSIDDDGDVARQWINKEDWKISQLAGFHGLIEKYYGIHEQVARLIDHVFEDQPTFEAAGDFAVAVIEAVPVGADLSQVWLTFREALSEEEGRIRSETEIGSGERTRAFTLLATWEADLLIKLLSTAPVPEPV